MTVDAHLLEAGSAAVKAGRAESLSAWVNGALAARVADERRLRALDEAIADYEAEFGVMTAAELAAQRRKDRQNAIVVRGKRGAARRRRRAV